MQFFRKLQNQLQKHEFLYFVLDLGVNLLILAGLVYLIRSFIMMPFQVHGPSMCDTMNFINNSCEYNKGEYLLVDKISYRNLFGYRISAPKRGDIIVFHPPKSSEQSEKYYIKRIIGLPGETLKLINGEVHIINQSNPNGFKVNEPYLNSENRNNTQIQQFGLDTFQIPENRYFVMGDNRNSSTDSRSCFQPKFSSKCDDGSSFLSMDQIEGKAWVSLWPISKIRVIEHAPKTDKY